MEKFCNIITNPEWWSVIATFIGAIAATWITYRLGKRQNELQEQQIRAQEYEVRKRLYLLLTNANREIDSFIKDLDRLLWEPWHNSNEGGLNHCKKRMIVNQRDVQISSVLGLILM